MHVVDVENGDSGQEPCDAGSSSAVVQPTDKAGRDVAEDADVHMKDAVKAEKKTPPSVGARRGRRRRGAASGGQVTLTSFMARTRKSQEAMQATAAVCERPEGKENVYEFKLFKSDVQFPLGWMLSGETRDAMQQQIVEMKTDQDSDFNQIVDIVTPFKKQ